jgi:hypothetical protein
LTGLNTCPAAAGAAASSSLLHGRYVSGYGGPSGYTMGYAVGFFHNVASIAYGRCALCTYFELIQQYRLVVNDPRMLASIDLLP